MRGEKGGAVHLSIDMAADEEEVTTADRLLAVTSVRANRRKDILLMLLVALSLTACLNPGSSKSFENKPDKMNTKEMKSVLIIGMDPHTIDFSNPEIPEGITVEKIETGTRLTVEKLNSLGYSAEVFLIETGTTDLSRLAKHLQKNNYGGVVIGNGIRGLAANFLLFEQIVNVVHSHARESKIIFNSLPTNTDEAVKRWL